MLSFSVSYNISLNFFSLIFFDKFMVLILMMELENPAYKNMMPHTIIDVILTIIYRVEDLLDFFSRFLRGVISLFACSSRPALILSSTSLNFSLRDAFSLLAALR